ncbi:unnamed protein product [Camellia sinensis]
MSENRRRKTPTVAAGGETREDLAMVSELSPTESELSRLRLRQRWEFASVLNFLHVFEPVIESKMKVSAEDIETALITPNNLLAQLHIMLLKGIPPISKALNGSDAWVMVLCKKLAMWWPWVAEGDIPLTAAKGEEIPRYKELDPTIRLLLLKALCEIRADQDDTVSYINDGLKNGTEISSFRKDKIGGDGNGTTYWYDGNEVTGYRLYKELSKFESMPKVKGKGLPTIISEWETLATNLEEFRKVVDEFLSSKAKLEVGVGKTIEVNVIPVLEKLHKSKERAMKKQQRKEILSNGFFNPGITRSCRNRRPVNYTFDEYDKAIDEAIQLTKKRKTTEEKHNSVRGKRNKTDSDGGSDTETDARNHSVDKHDSNASDTESDELHGGHDEDYEKDDGDNDQSKELAGTANHSDLQTKNLGAKNRSRQRPTRNSALESAVVPDSEDGHSSDETSNGVSGSEHSESAGRDDDSDGLNAFDQD